MYRRFKLELPVSAVSLQAEKPDGGDVHSLLAMNSDEPKGLGQRGHLADRSDIDERGTGPKANLGFPSGGLQVVDVIRVDHAVLSAGDVYQDSMGCHTDFVARLGRYTHWLVIHRMGWCSGE
jgi:hypothetical protein